MADQPNLAAALVAALTDLCVVEKSRTANAGSYSYDYADLAAVVGVTRSSLAKHDVIALTPIHDHGPGLACTVVLLHSSGERMDLGPFPFPPGRDAQATGSMVTYHRRYALLAALGMATGEDDDGAAAVPAAPAPPVTWNKNVAKQHLAAKLGKDQAKHAWEQLELDQIDEWSEALADRYVAEWVADNAAPLSDGADA